DGADDLAARRGRGAGDRDRGAGGPADHPLASQGEADLSDPLPKSSGRLTLTTAPSGARVELHRQEDRGGWLEAVFDRALGETPLIDVEVEAGSHLLVLQAPGCSPTTYPIDVQPGRAWCVVAPGEAAPRAVPL